MLLLNYNSLGGYESVQFILRDVGGGWLIKLIHANNASFIFLVLYLHLFKNIFVEGYSNKRTWLRGLIILYLIIGAAFRGYVLVGAQIRH